MRPKSLNLIKRLLLEQYNSATEIVEFIGKVKSIIDKRPPKINTVFIIGGAGSGKTFFLDTLINLIWSVGFCESNFNKTRNFPLENLLRKRMGVINEFSCEDSMKDTCKELFEGTRTIVNAKYKSRTTIPRTPIFITTNNPFGLGFSGPDRRAFEQRMFVERWSPQPWLKKLKGKPHPLIWAKLYNVKEEDFDDVPPIAYFDDVVHGNSIYLAPPVDQNSHIDLDRVAMRLWETLA